MTTWSGCWPAAEALGTMLATPDGANLLAAYKRAANILRIETRKDGPHDGPVDPALLVLPAEQALAGAVEAEAAAVAASLAAEDAAAGHDMPSPGCAPRSMRSSRAWS